jgi:hypothetical protein
MPVSKSSVRVESSVTGGGSRWIGQRSFVSAAERGLAHGHRERGAGVDHRLAANQAVGRAEGHAANLAAAEMLLHLADQVDGDALLVAVDADGVVDRGDRVLGKLNVERRADDLGDLAGSLRCRCHVDSCLSWLKKVSGLFSGPLLVHRSGKVCRKES